MDYSKSSIDYAKQAARDHNLEINYRCQDYLDLALQVDQYIVIEADGSVSVYRTWQQEYTRESISSELRAGGFEVQSFWGDLTGMPFTDDTEWIGIIARKNIISPRTRSAPARQD